MSQVYAVTLSFHGFIDAETDEISVLFRHKAIPYDRAVQELIRNGPGEHRAIITKYMGTRLLDRGDFNAFITLFPRWREYLGVEIPDIKKQYLLGELKDFETVAGLIFEQISRVEFLLSAQAEVLVRGEPLWMDTQANIIKATQLGKWPSPEIAYFWKEIDQLYAESFLGSKEIVMESLAEFGLTLNFDPDANWPIKVIE